MNASWLMCMYVYGVENMIFKKYVWSYEHMAGSFLIPHFNFFIILCNWNYYDCYISFCHFVLFFTLYNLRVIKIILNVIHISFFRSSIMNDKRTIICKFCSIFYVILLNLWNFINVWILNREVHSLWILCEIVFFYRNRIVETIFFIVTNLISPNHIHILDIVSQQKNILNPPLLLHGFEHYGLSEWFSNISTWACRWMMVFWHACPFALIPFDTRLIAYSFQSTFLQRILFPASSATPPSLPLRQRQRQRRR